MEISCRQARSIKRPTTIEVREATVGPLFGTISVSGAAMVTSLYSMPSVSAAICVRIVFVPWPNSVFDTRTRTLPSGVTSTPPSEFRYNSPEPVNPEP